MEHCQVQFAIDDPEAADRIIDELLDRRLVACAQRLGPIESHYSWHGSREVATEWLVLLKTSAERAAATVTAVEELHPYEVPEVVIVPVTASGAYAHWIDVETA